MNQDYWNMLINIFTIINILKMTSEDIYKPKQDQEVIQISK